MTEKKLVQQLKDIAKRYPDSFLQCRDHGHTWQPVEAAWLQDGNIERILACTRCEGRRIQVLNKNGYIVGNRYDYQDNYPLVGVGRLDVDGKAIFRRTAVLKQLG